MQTLLIGLDLIQIQILQCINMITERLLPQESIPEKMVIGLANSKRQVIRL